MLQTFEADSLTMLPGIRHGFFTRTGGVSTGIYRGLNCGAGSNDDRVSVSENRALAARHLNCPHGDIVTLYQAHSADALVVDQPVARESLPKADGLVTKTRGLAIGVLTADCTPVLFADAKAKVVGAAHAGWRGALSGVLEATVAQMEVLGATRGNIRATIGPCISQNAYEVGPEFEEQFLKQSLTLARFFTRASKQAKSHFDLPGFVNFRLQALNLANTELSAPCTYQNESLFYSFRRSQHRSEPDYGRQISAIVVT